MCRQRRSFAAVLLLVSGTLAWLKPTYPEQDPQHRWRNQLPEFRTTAKQAIHQQTSRITQMKWKNCGTDHDPIQLKMLTLPTVINLKSSFNFSIDAVLSRKIKAPLKVTMKVQRHFLLWWVTVPCLEGVFGSCHFSDLCTLLPGHDNSTCPPVFVQHNLPCGCPAGPAEYSAEDVPVDLSSVDIPEELAAGSYYVRAALEDGSSGQLLGCFDVYLSLE